MLFGLEYLYELEDTLLESLIMKEQKCTNHPERIVLSFCNVCKKYFCKDCLNEGNEYYYCNNQSCYEKYKEEYNEELKSITPKEIQIYSGFTYRAVAIIIDSAILFVINTIIFIPFYFIGTQINPADVIIDMDWFVVFRNPFFYWIGLFYFSFMESSKRKGTIGKRMQEIVVVDRRGNKISFARAFARNFCRIFSALSIVGYLLPLLLRKKQALHDLICGTLVLNANVLPIDINNQNVFCSSCKNEIKLNLEEIIKKEFICPNCSSLNLTERGFI